VHVAVAEVDGGDERDRVQLAPRLSVLLLEVFHEVQRHGADLLRINGHAFERIHSSVVRHEDVGPPPWSMPSL
jgi:hypothetical protein